MVKKQQEKLEDSGGETQRTLARKSLVVVKQTNI